MCLHGNILRSVAKREMYILFSDSRRTPWNLTGRVLTEIEMFRHMIADYHIFFSIICKKLKSFQIIISVLLILGNKASNKTLVNLILRKKKERQRNSCVKKEETKYFLSSKKQHFFNFLARQSN